MAKYTRDITIENMTIEDCEMSGVGLEECFMPIVRGCRILRATSPTYLGLGLGYGVWLGTATYAGLVENCYFEECRHSVAAGGETPSFYGSVYKNNSINAGVGSEDFDCHEATYGYRFVGNTTNANRAYAAAASAATTGPPSTRPLSPMPISATPTTTAGHRPVAASRWYLFRSSR